MAWNHFHIFVRYHAAEGGIVYFEGDLSWRLVSVAVARFLRTLHRRPLFGRLPLKNIFLKDRDLFWHVQGAVLKHPRNLADPPLIYRQLAHSTWAAKGSSTQWTSAKCGRERSRTPRKGRNSAPRTRKTGTKTRNSTQQHTRTAIPW
jgi:hypothetical protein